MITISDNTCGESIGYGLGWLALDNFVRASGYTKTAISSYNVTSANDTATFLEKLEGGQLLSAEHRATLLGYMSQQIYRSAIPAGAPGIKVVDKVGFTPNNWNDAAIVYHPKGTYVLVVLSKDAGTDPIKDLSARVSAFMNR